MHLYEGLPPATVVHGVRMAVSAGCRTVVLTNAAGGIRSGLSVGQPVLISDHLNLTGASPLAGPPPSVGQRFTDLTDLYSPRLRSLARGADPSLAEGVYAMMPGPHDETPAEIRMLGRRRRPGWMSTVLEAIAARHLGAEVLGISLVTNLAAGLAGHGLSHAEVIEAGQASASRMGALLASILPEVEGLRGAGAWQAELYGQVVGQRRVVVGVVQRVGVHHGAGQAGDRVDQPVLGADRDVVRLHAVSCPGLRRSRTRPGAWRPTQRSRTGRVQDARRGPQRRLGLIGQGRIHAVHETPATSGRLPSPPPRWPP